MSENREGPRYLVVGAGGIGGVVAAHLVEQGHDVTTLSTNSLIRDAINAHGFRLRGEASPGNVRGQAVGDLKKTPRPFDYVLLATQPPQVEEAARNALPHLADAGAMVCFQNGLCEEHVARVVGRERVIGAIVAWGASMVEPGIYDRTSSGGFSIGRLEASTAPSGSSDDGADDEALRELARALECIGPTATTRNLIGARWSKLAINCAISSLGTVGGDRLGPLMRHRFVRRLALEIMTEATAVAKASGVKLEKVSGTLDLEWISLSETDKTSSGSASLVAKHALLLAVGARYRRLRSSMLSAIERGRAPSVDFLNGEVVRRGRELGIATPINQAIRDEVLAIAAHRSKSSFSGLRAFFDRTRSIANAQVEPEPPASAPPMPPPPDPPPSAAPPEPPPERSESEPAP